jgi:hypothetical protein
MSITIEDCEAFANYGSLISARYKPPNIDPEELPKAIEVPSSSQSSMADLAPGYLVKICLMMYRIPQRGSPLSYMAMRDILLRKALTRSTEYCLLCTNTMDMHFKKARMSVIS